MEQHMYRRTARRRGILLAVAFILTCAFSLGLKGADGGIAGFAGSNARTVHQAKKVLREHPEYPAELTDMLKNNPETAQFILDYGTEAGKDHDTDISGELKTGQIPLFIQWDERWGYETYGNKRLAADGCGPTSLSMVLAGLTQDAKWTPLKVAQFAENNGYYVDGSGSSWDLMKSGAEQLGLHSRELSKDASVISKELQEGHPVICIMGPGDFTTGGHFIVLTAINGNGTVIVNDSNSVINSNKEWDLDDIIPQMKNLWAFSR